MAAAGEFVEGWLVAQVLGEGAYGEVRLLVHARSGASVALKSVRAAEGGGAAREAALHRALRHPHVLRCLGERTHRGVHHLFLEYAQGGELFERIEPDRGMPEAAARRYWRQLLAGLRYLHGRGVAHRDIKPENLLLDGDDNLKISDFGMATLFRHGQGPQARERLLSRVCGTVPYAAPEVLAAELRPYRAAPADLWAAAVVLLAMLAGELPWERAHESDERFGRWAEGGACEGVWAKLTAGARALLQRALCPQPSRRPTLEELLRERWMSDDSDVPEPCDRESALRAWCSQPARGASALRRTSTLSPDDMEALLSHSQPARAEDLLLSSADGSPRSQRRHSLLQRLVRRMPRVWVRGGEAAALRAAGDALARRGCAWRALHPRVLAAECGADAALRMRVCVVRHCARRDATLLEFRRWRGCGLLFKRKFLELRDDLAFTPTDQMEL